MIINRSTTFLLTVACMALLSPCILCCSFLCVVHSLRHSRMHGSFVTLCSMLLFPSCFDVGHCCARCLLRQVKHSTTSCRLNFTKSTSWTKQHTTHLEIHSFACLIHLLYRASQRWHPHKKITTSMRTALKVCAEKQASNNI